MRATVILWVLSLLMASRAEAFDHDGLSDEMTAPVGNTKQIDLARKHFEEGVLRYRAERVEARAL